MPTLHCGIDEAGYGPILGPLSIASVCAAVDDGCDLRRVFRGRRTGVKDSKEIHTSGDIEPIECVALAAIRWLTGSVPANAAECFALVGESAEHRRDKPWMQMTENLKLPVAAKKIAQWTLPGIQPVAVNGALVQPCRFNRTIRLGTNKADLELACIQALLAQLPSPHGETIIVIDRLGGRRYYASHLQEVWPRARVDIVSEADPILSSYVLTSGEHTRRISFCVEGEKQSPLTAMASCIAKYLRELHMVLLNRYWCEQRPDLKKTAGYGSDAQRWVRQLGADLVATHGGILIRGHGVEPAQRAAPQNEKG